MLGEKVDVHSRRSAILGLCNRLCAYHVQQPEPISGAMLPCSLIVQEAEGNKVAREVRVKLKEVTDTLG